MAVPKSVLVIPDGNRTYFDELGVVTKWVHAKGLAVADVNIRRAFSLGVEHVVFWGASKSNLTSRPSGQVDLLCKLLKSEINWRRFKPENFRFRLCGSWKQFCNDKKLEELVYQLESESAMYNDRQLTVLFGYSGKMELVEAAKSVIAAGEEITEESMRRHLWSSYVPDIDLIIRTGTRGDPHWSDAVLPFQTANSQLYFTPLCWPEFTPEELAEVCRDFGKRQRRLGA